MFQYSYWTFPGQHACLISVMVLRCRHPTPDRHCPTAKVRPCAFQRRRRQVLPVQQKHVLVGSRRGRRFSDWRRNFPCNSFFRRFAPRHICTRVVLQMHHACLPVCAEMPPSRRTSPPLRSPLYMWRRGGTHHHHTATTFLQPLFFGHYQRTRQVWSTPQAQALLNDHCGAQILVSFGYRAGFTLSRFYNPT